jgi:hypothetical protein
VCLCVCVCVSKQPATSPCCRYYHSGAPGAWATKDRRMQNIKPPPSPSTPAAPPITDDISLQLSPPAPSHFLVFPPPPSHDTRESSLPRPTPRCLYRTFDDGDRLPSLLGERRRPLFSISNPLAAPPSVLLRISPAAVTTLQSQTAKKQSYAIIHQSFTDIVPRERIAHSPPS